VFVGLLLWGLNYYEHIKGTPMKTRIAQNNFNLQMHTDDERSSAIINGEQWQEQILTTASRGSG